MNREEILRQLNYKGKYTKDVKKKLNKLLKKYHPDNNKEDMKTILVLYEVKKELENGTLKYNDYNSKKNEKDDSSDIETSKIYVFFIESMIERLKGQRDRINKKLSSIYKKINFHNERMDNKQDEVTYIEFEINQLEEELDALLKIDVIDKFILIVIVIFILFAFLLKNIYVFILVFMFILIELYYVYIRDKSYKEKKKILLKSVKILRNVKNEYDQLEEKIDNLEKQELKLKGERNRINNDLQYYNHEISKVNEKDLNYTKEKNNKTYTK